MNKTKIEWCDITLNPIVGCTYGCEYCYAKKLNDRFKWVKNWNEPQFFQERLRKLSTIRNPQNIFMNSMSDIADWGEKETKQIIRVMQMNNKHNYLFLTKRPSKFEYYRYLDMPNIWVGTTVTDNLDLGKISSLVIKTLPYVKMHKFISFEPLHDNLKIYNHPIEDYNWIIIGAETGNRKGKITPKKEWIDDIVKIASEFKIPVFMKDSLINIIGEEGMLRQFPKELKKEDKQ